VAVAVAVVDQVFLDQMVVVVAVVNIAVVVVEAETLQIHRPLKEVMVEAEVVVAAAAAVELMQPEEMGQEQLVEMEVMEPHLLFQARLSLMLAAVVVVLILLALPGRGVVAVAALGVLLTQVQVLQALQVPAAAAVQVGFTESLEAVQAVPAS
jgi:hypothetical protein